MSKRKSALNINGADASYKSLKGTRQALEVRRVSSRRYVDIKCCANRSPCANAATAPTTTYRTPARIQCLEYRSGLNGSSDQPEDSFARGRRASGLAATVYNLRHKSCVRILDCLPVRL